MKKIVIVVLIITSFILGVVLDRAYEYQTSGKRRIELIKENEELLKDYENLQEKLDMIKPLIEQPLEKNDTVIN